MHLQEPLDYLWNSLVSPLPPKGGVPAFSQLWVLAFS
jgi:hypothetical protein